MSRIPEHAPCTWIRSRQASVVCLIVILLLVLGVLPWISGDYYINLSSQIFIAALFAASLNLLVGYAGLPSLGHKIALDKFMGLARH